MYPVNRLKRFVFACCFKIYNETYDNILAIDEFTVEIRLASHENLNKKSTGLLRAENGKIGKAKHSNVKIHLLRGISHLGPTRLVLFKGKMNSSGFQHYFGLGVGPFNNQQIPFRHRLYMDNLHNKMIRIICYESK